MTDNHPVRFNAHEIMETFGGVRGVIDALATVGYKAGTKTVQKWRERDSIPSPALAALMLYKMRGGEVWMLHNYLQEADDVT